MYYLGEYTRMRLLMIEAHSPALDQESHSSFEELATLLPPETGEFSPETMEMFQTGLHTLPEEHQKMASIGIGLLGALANGTDIQKVATGSADIINDLQRMADADPIVFVGLGIILFLLFSSVIGLTNAKHITQSRETASGKRTLAWGVIFSIGGFAAFTQIQKFFDNPVATGGQAINSMQKLTYTVVTAFQGAEATLHHLMQLLENLIN